jgi:hypothetical protein
MCALYKPTAILQLSDQSLRMVSTAVGLPLVDDSMVMRLENQSNGHLTESIGRLVGQSFCVALSEELQRRGFTARSIAMRTVTRTERPDCKGTRARVELDVVANVPRMTQNEFIDAMQAAKGKSALAVPATAKVILNAGLETGN